MPDPFYSRRSLHVDIYPVRTSLVAVIEGDAEFYTALALAAPGPALELGCGAGRLVLALANAGVSVTGLDLSEPMLESAEAAVARQAEEVQSRIRLVHGDMTSFEMEERFGFIYVAFRSFMMLTTPEAQRACLTRIHEHLVPGGTLAIDIFDPLLDRMVPGPMPDALRSQGVVPHPSTWNLVRAEAATRENDAVAQVFTETWRFTEVDRNGSTLREEEEVLTMRWTYRYEMRYLLELCGFEVLAEYSDYHKSPPAYGKEQVWVARKR